MLKITHNKPTCRTLLGKTEMCPSSKTVDIPDGSSRAFVDLPGDGHAYVYSEPPEPAAIPMSDMKPGVGCVVTVDDDERIVTPGDWVIKLHNGTAQRLADSDVIEPTGVTVRLLQPGESLLIERLPDEPEKPDAPDEPPAAPGSESAPRRCAHCKHIGVPWHNVPCVDDCFNTDAHKHFACDDTNEARAANPGASPEPQADDQFERLEDGSRIMCKNCNDSWKGCSPPVASMDPRGYKGCGHPCWKPKPPTLDDALRTGTAEEGMEILTRNSRGWGLCWNDLRDAVRNVFGDMFDRVISRVAASRVAPKADCSCLLSEVVELRDRLDLFGEGK